MEIKIKELSYKYPNADKFAIQNINLDLIDGKINGIIGPNGSGKTTLIEIIAGLKMISSGELEIGKYKINSLFPKELRSNIGILFQTSQKQFFNKTVKEEIGLCAKTFNYRINELDKRINDALKMVGLDETYLDKNPFTLSNSEAKKVALASILIYNPKIIILDEPTIGLDSKSKSEFIKLMRMLKNRYKKTIIITTHDMEMLHKIVDKVIVLNDGKVVMEGSKYEVFSKVKELKKYNIIAPKVILFSDKVLNKKKIKLGYRDEVNDLVKDIFRNVY